MILAESRAGADFRHVAACVEPAGGDIAGEAKPGSGRISFRLDAAITRRKFDARRFVTEIGTSQALGKEDLSGSVVRIGKQWSVVKSGGPDSLVLWGKVTDQAPVVEILAHYLEAR